MIKDTRLAPISLIFAWMSAGMPSSSNSAIEILDWSSRLSMICWKEATIGARVSIGVILRGKEQEGYAGSLMYHSFLTSGIGVAYSNEAYAVRKLVRVRNAFFCHSALSFRTVEDPSKAGDISI